MATSERDKKIIRTSVVGIAGNAVLVAFKLLVGVFANSIAVILDAVNNLSDALSSTITIIGTKLAGKAPDKKHPFGHGRIEYITSVIIAAIVLWAGATSLVEAVKAIIENERANYSVLSLVVIGVAVLVKLAMGLYVKKTGEKINSQALVASGSDAFFDSILSLATLAAALVTFFLGDKLPFALEGVLAGVISLYIIKAGVQMIGETLSSIIGARTDKELSDKIKSKILSYEEVRGVYDLILHDYGPTRTIGSLHIEVEDGMTAREIHMLTRRISMDVALEFGIILTIGIYAANDSDGAIAEMKNQVAKIVEDTPEILQFHGFYVDEKNKSVMFDLIVDFKANGGQVREKVVSALSALYPSYRFDVVLDTDFTE